MGVGRLKVLCVVKKQFSMLKTVQNIWAFSGLFLAFSGFFPVTSLNPMGTSGEVYTSLAGWGVGEKI